MDEKRVAREVAMFMILSARTAPKARGIDHLKTAILTGQEKDRLAGEMEKLSSEYGFFERDAKNVRSAEVVLLIGLSAAPIGLNCGACGRTCTELQGESSKEGKGYRGPLCVMDIMNFGIALGSAVKTASMFNVDNRMMFSAGVAARKSGIMDADVVIGIPLSIKGKNIFFDRK